MTETNTNPAPGNNFLGGDDAETIDFAAAFGFLRAGWPLILAFVLIGYAHGKFSVFVTPKTYRTDALLQVEQTGNQASIALQSRAASMMDGPTSLPSEIEILKSRRVLGKVAEKLGLDTVVRPVYFSRVGAAFARQHKGSNLAAPPPWLRPFAAPEQSWGGEIVDVTRFDVSPDLIFRTFWLVGTDGDRFHLEANDGTVIATGSAGEVVRTKWQNGTIELFVRDLQVRPLQRFVIVKQPIQIAALQLKAGLSTDAIGGSRWNQDMLEVSFTGQDREQVTRILNGILDEYQRQNIERRSEETQQTLEFMRRQLPDLRTQLEAAETAMNEFKVSQGSADLTRETGIILDRLVELESQLAQLRQQRAEALERVTENHPLIESIDSQISQLENGVASINSRVSKLPSVQQRALRLTRNVEVLTSLYISMLNRSQELEVVKSGTIGNVRIIDPPVRPMRASGPNARRMIATSIGIALVLSLAILTVMRLMHRGVNDPKQVERRTGLPTLATIPYSSQQSRLARVLKRGKAESGLLAISDPTGIAMEAIRSARTALHFVRTSSKNNLIMITGPEPGVGKSFIASNLAAALAMAGSRVVLIDADMRRGHMHSGFGMEKANGLSELLSQQIAIDQAATPSVIENLDVITCGTYPPNPAELLVGKHFADTLADLESRYQYVIIDTPPSLAVTDSTIIGRLAGTVLMVLKSGEHSMRLIEDSFQRLINGGVRVDGTIFNQVGKGAGNRYGYGGYGYSYGGYSYKYQPRKEAE